MYDMMIIHTILVDMMRRIVADCRLTGTTINMKRSIRAGHLLSTREEGPQVQGSPRACLTLSADTCLKLRDLAKTTRLWSVIEA